MKVAELQRAPRTHRLTALFLSWLALVVLVPASRSTQAADNPIVLENQQPGSNGWMWSKIGDDVITPEVLSDAVGVQVRDPRKVLHPAVVDPVFVGDVDGPGPDLALVQITDLEVGELPPNNRAVWGRGRVLRPEAT